ILEYLFRVTLYCQARSGAAYIAHENLELHSSSEGGPSAIVQAMLKDFKPVKDYLLRQYKALERFGGDMPKTDGVGAWYTSQKCNYCARLGVQGILDDSASADYAICSSCGRIYDRHGSSTGNIADRFITAHYGNEDEPEEGGGE
ncbi:MAG: hypothetical protein RBG13Loki_1885, partial [Promethearchaeota archaeon CR_4]